MQSNLLGVRNRAEFREWLEQYADVEQECWVSVKRGKPADDENFWYLDAVEEALCFGWIDSTFKKINGLTYNRFSPRKKNSPWSELNKERVRRLEKLGLMTDMGRDVLPNMNFEIDPMVRKDIEVAGLWNQFASFPELYQRVRAYNLSFARYNKSIDYEKAFANFVKNTSEGKTYGEWSDYGRLLEY